MKNGGWLDSYDKAQDGIISPNVTAQDQYFQEKKKEDEEYEKLIGNTGEELIDFGQRFVPGLKNLPGIGSSFAVGEAEAHNQDASLSDEIGMVPHPYTQAASLMLLYAEKEKENQQKFAENRDRGKTYDELIRKEELNPKVIDNTFIPKPKVGKLKETKSKYKPKLIFPKITYKDNSFVMPKEINEVQIDNTYVSKPRLKNGGWLDSYEDGGKMQEHQENYNDNSVSLPEGFVGEGYNTKGRNYSPAWGGQFQMGGSVYPVNYVPEAQGGMSMPGSVGFTYARTQSPAPSNGKYAKKTMASAQDGNIIPIFKNNKLNFSKPKYDYAWANDKKSLKSKVNPRLNSSEIKTIKDVNKQTLKNPSSLYVKSRDYDLEQSKINNTYYNQLAAQKQEEDRRSKLTKDELERENYNNYSEQFGNISEYVPESGWDRTKAIVSNPLTAFGYAARNQNLPARFQYGERNTLDNAIDWVNPLQGVAALSEIPGELGRGEYLNAGLSALDAVDLGVYAKGAMKASKPFLQKGAQQLSKIPTSIAPELRQGLQTNGISDLYKINPWATKIDDAATKIVGEGKNSFIYDPAKPMYHRTYKATPNFLTGYKQIKKPNQLDFSPIINPRTEEFKNKALQNFKTLTGGKGDDIDLEQFVDYFKKEQERLFTKFQYQDFLTNINREKYYDTPEWKNVWDDSRDQAEDIFGKIEETLQQKSSPLGKRLGSGAEGSVYELADDPDKVIKIGNTFKTSSADDLVKSFEGITDDNIARVLRAHQDNKHLIEIMPNLNANAKFSNFTKEQVLGKLEKDAKGLMDRGFQLDVDNINGNFRYNPDKNKVDIYDISKPAAGQTSQNPEAVLRILRDHFNDAYRIPGTHPLYDPNMPTPEFKQGGIIKDDRGQWAHPGEITEIGSNQITMQGVPYPVLGISDEGDTQMMYPEEEYKFKGKKVTEFPMAKNGLRQEQKGLVNLDQLTNFTNYNKPQPGGWLNKYN
jgi:hypothetical protein